MRVYEFTKPELDFFRETCNFTADERVLFDMRASGISLERCAEEMNISVSTAKRISRRVNRKILRVI